MTYQFVEPAQRVALASDNAVLRFMGWQVAEGYIEHRNWEGHPNRQVVEQNQWPER